jgi:chromate transporter
MQPAVAALIVRAVHRNGSHALHENLWLWGIACLGALAQLLRVNFLITLLLAGLVFALVERKQKVLALTLAVVFLIWTALVGLSGSQAAQGLPDSASTLTQPASLLTLFWSGLRSGLLTFGGAYTVIPFLQQDAVEIGRWMTNAQFLD